MTDIEPKNPLLAVDTVVFSVVDGVLSALLIQINSGNYQGKWAIPGGLVKVDESLDAAAIRVLRAKTSLKGIYLEQLYTFGDPKRDIRGRSVSVAYFALINTPKDIEIKTLEFYKDIKWFPLDKLPEMAFDHKIILSVAHKRLKDKLSYTNIAYSLLPHEFTLTDMQKIYEIVLGEKLDKRNFRKKIKSLEMLESLGRMQEEVTHRPAELYKFKEHDLRIF